jgi:hypothetical protein
MDDGLRGWGETEGRGGMVESERYGEGDAEEGEDGTVYERGKE